MQFLLLSGLSGAGKTHALQTLEDEGYLCIDNLPLSFLPSFIQMYAQKNYKKIAVVVDARGFLEDHNEVENILKTFNEDQTKANIIFLEAKDEVILERYRSTRRRHPLFTEKDSLAQSIIEERELLEPMRKAAKWIIDTSNLGVHELSL